MDTSIHDLSKEMADLLHDLISCCRYKDNHHASKFKVSTSECRTLRVFETNEELTMKELASEMDLAMSRMTRIVDGLVKKSLVERGSDPKDRRVCLVHLTAKGKRLVNEMQKSYLEMNQRVLENVSPNARPEVLKALRHLVVKVPVRVWIFNSILSISSPVVDQAQLSVSSLDEIEIFECFALFLCTPAWV